jgi:uncharacterized protein (DUF2384 family)
VHRLLNPALPKCGNSATLRGKPEVGQFNRGLDLACSTHSLSTGSSKFTLTVSVSEHLTHLMLAEKSGVSAQTGNHMRLLRRRKTQHILFVMGTSSGHTKALHLLEIRSLATESISLLACYD